jgi:hypothetical protein
LQIQRIAEQQEKLLPNPSKGGKELIAASLVFHFNIAQQ